MLQRAGITPAIITGRDSAALRTRLAALGITQAVYGTEDKLPAAEKLLAELGCAQAQAAAMGDDWPDLTHAGASRLCCCACQRPCRNQSPRTLRHTNELGGHGAVRELCDILLQAGGHYAETLRRYLPPVASAPQQP